MKREKWKQRALSKQKKLRAMEIKVRDISLSREKWKEKALKLEASLKEKESEIEELKKKLEWQNKLELSRNLQ